jgi:flagellar basal body rod protein FlgG
MPTDGIASAASALRYWERRQEIAANNLANATTSGFKAERVFARLLGTDVVAPGARTDWSDGTLATTGNPLDLALRGRDFFVVATAQGERLSRGGAWQIDPDGFLADTDGNRVLGEKGPVRIAGRDVSIDRTGRVAVDDRWIDRLRVETVAADVPLTHDAGTRWLADPARRAVPPEARDVRQGHLEASNVESVGELADMIAIQRNYAFVQKAITTLSDIRSTIANDLAKPSA